MTDQSPVIENMLKALLESLAYLMAPINQSATSYRLMKKLRMKDTVTTEEDYHDTIITMARKPCPALGAYGFGVDFAK